MKHIFKYTDQNKKWFLIFSMELRSTFDLKAKRFYLGRPKLQFSSSHEKLEVFHKPKTLTKFIAMNNVAHLFKVIISHCWTIKLRI